MKDPFINLLLCAGLVYLGVTIIFVQKASFPNFLGILCVYAGSYGMGYIIRSQFMEKIKNDKTKKSNR